MATQTCRSLLPRNEVITAVHDQGPTIAAEEVRHVFKGAKPGTNVRRDRYHLARIIHRRQNRRSPRRHDRRSVDYRCGNDVHDLSAGVAAADRWSAPYQARHGDLSRLRHALYRFPTAASRPRDAWLHRRAETTAVEIREGAHG